MADDDQTPTPDPTVLTTAQLVRATSAERDYVNGRIDVLRQRLDGIDKATEVLNETVNRVPTALTEGLGHLQAVMDERFTSIREQFRERDIRSERESRDNKVAVDAAFAAQKEAASEQNKSNTLAISKSETATTETINKLAELVGTQIKAMGDKLDDLKERVGRMESVKAGAAERRNEGRASLSSTTAGIGAAVAVLLVALAIYAAFRTPVDSTPQQPVVVTVTVPAK
jgi:chromosome segregation ATPase